MTSPVDNPRAVPEFRVGDLERDQAAEQLRDQYALGRLDEPEFQQRLDAVFAARTATELRELVVDLPTGSRPVDWRSGLAPTEQAAGLGSLPAPWYGDGHRQHALGRGYRHGFGRRRGPGHGHWHGAEALRWGRRWPPYHRGPGFLPLLPILGMMFFFGGWAMTLVLPLVLGALLFSGVRHAAWSR